jgi:chemotaxis protein methyltransferase CheR
MTTCQPPTTSNQNMHIKQVEKALAARFGWQTGDVWRDKLIDAIGQKSARLRIDERTYCQSAVHSFSELQALAEFVINSETRFFRDEQQFAQLQQNIVPQLLESRAAERTLNVWSAACSTGEEAYSVAILIRQQLPASENWRVNVMATDLRGQAIITAAQGRYSASALSLLNPEWRARYFVRSEANGHEAAYTIVPEIKKLVTFRRANLYDQDFWKAFHQQFDLILCNHLLLHFHALAVKQTVEKFVKVLRSDGYFAVMKGEAIYVDHSQLKALPAYNSPFFKKL